MFSLLGSNYDPITHHHYLEFQHRRREGSGENFQQLFEDIMVRTKPGFVRVRPYGNIGDRKCDGLFREDGQFFQVYSPDELTQAKTQKKINDDLDGAVAYWGNTLKSWTFVYNVNRGIPPDVLGTLEEKQKQYPNIKIDHLSNDSLWEIARKLSTQKRSEILGAPPSEFKGKLASESFISGWHETNWPELCRRMLPTELDSNPLISGDGVTLGIEDILPLDLAERKERPRPTRDPSPENFQQTLEEQETPLPYDQLFAHVLAECKSLNQQGKGIALIGEPGSGKTTLLCAIATWVLERGELPIFVSLRSLEGKLEDYILQDWLKDAGNVRKASEQFQDALVEQCNAGQVWLLLDGIDEMSQANEALHKLAQELKKGWLSNVRIVLTCRINVWGANRNDLGSKLQEFRSRGLKHEDQLVFIRKFFTKAQQLETGEQLIRELENAPLRLKDLIKNPLWITLLCRTWKRRSGKLPKTKSELYRGFVNTLYEWKNESRIPEQKRYFLEQALGEIAKKIIDREASRFSFSESFVCEELNRFDPSFFYISCKLGWITKLGIVAGNSEESIYTFLHPTFQEYFAALAINSSDKWDFFLPANHIDSPSEGKKYRIFLGEWQEVISLWVGLSSQESKTNFFKALLNFKDGCQDFFKQRAILLATILTAETGVQETNLEIYEQIILACWDLYHFPENRLDRDLPLKDSAKAALLKAKTELVTTVLERMIEKLNIAELDSTCLTIFEMYDRIIAESTLKISLSQFIFQISQDNEMANKLFSSVICFHDEIYQIGNFLSKVNPESQKIIDLADKALKFHDLYCAFRYSPPCEGKHKSNVNKNFHDYFEKEKPTFESIAKRILEDINLHEQRENPETHTENILDALESILEELRFREHESCSLLNLFINYLDIPWYQARIIALILRINPDLHDNWLRLENLLESEDVDANWVSMETLLSLKPDHGLAIHKVVTLIESLELNSEFFNIGIFSKEGHIVLVQEIRKLLSHENPCIRELAGECIVFIGAEGNEEFKVFLELMDDKKFSTSALDSLTRFDLSCVDVSLAKEFISKYFCLFDPKEESLRPKIDNCHYQYFLKSSRLDYVLGNCSHAFCEYLVSLGSSLLENSANNGSTQHFLCRKILWIAANKMSYPDFYQVWNTTILKQE